MTFIIYYQHNYNYYQYKQTEIKLQFYLFREYLPETILNHHLAATEKHSRIAFCNAGALLDPRFIFITKNT